MVEGTVPYTVTHLKANANKNRYDKQVAAKSRSDYWNDLDAAIDADRAAHGKKPLKDKVREPVEKESKISRTDPDSGYMVRDGKPKGFFYLDHRTVDGRLGIITDTHATPANVHDSIVYLSRLDWSAPALALMLERLGWMRAMRRLALRRVSKIAPFPASPAIADRRRPSRA